ncbi:MAG: TetR/AcrR family transcriptional regulator [Archangium sp.]
MGRLKTPRAPQTGRAERPAPLSTDERIIAAAVALLDEGGEAAVTLRAVAQASDVSHNAPYKHFENRDALLAAVAIKDFEMLRATLAVSRASSKDPLAQLKHAFRGLVEFSHQHPARYGLLFNNQAIARAGGRVKEVAQAMFFEVVAVVLDCQKAGKLPSAPGATLASLIFATLHGLISIEATSGFHPEKGLRDIESSVDLLFELIKPRSPR